MCEEARLLALAAAAQVFQGTGAQQPASELGRAETSRQVVADVLMASRAFEAYLSIRRLRASFSKFTGNQETGTFTPSNITFNDEGDAVAVTMTDLGTGTLSIKPEDFKGNVGTDTITWVQVDTPAGASEAGAPGSVLTITPDDTTLNLAVSAVAPGSSQVTGTDPAGNVFTESFGVDPSQVTQLVPNWTPGPDQPTT